MELWLLAPFLVVFLAAFLSYYLAFPLRLRHRFRVTAEPTFVPIPNEDSLPAEVGEHFQRVGDALQTLGFEVIGVFAIPDSTPRVVTMVKAMANRSAKDVAVASVSYLRSITGTRVLSRLTEFACRFRTGELIQTSNSQTSPGLPSQPNNVTAHFPTVRETGRLYRLHQVFARKYGSASERVFRLDEEFGGDYVAAIRAAIREMHDYQVESGYLLATEDGKAYRLTMKGAYLIIWKLFWPLRGVSKALRDRQNRRILAELESSADLQPI